MRFHFGSRVAIRPWSWAVALVLTLAAAPARAASSDAHSSRGRGTAKAIVTPTGSSPQEKSTRVSPYGRLLQRQRAAMSDVARSSQRSSGGGKVSGGSSQNQALPER